MTTNDLTAREQVMKQEINNLKFKNTDLQKSMSSLERKLDTSQRQSLMLLEDRRSLKKKSIQHSFETMGGIFNPRAMRLVENATLSDTYSKSNPLMTELSVPVNEGGNIPEDTESHYVRKGKQTRIFRGVLNTGH